MKRLLRFVTSRTTQADVETEAAKWFARVQSDARTPSDEAALRKWLAQDPLHELAYYDIDALWGRLEKHQDTAAIARMRHQALADARQGEQDRMWARVRWQALAATILLFMVLGLLLGASAMNRESTYTTAVGDRQTVLLSDGSEVTLNTDTILRVRFRFWEREVILDRGEVHLKVAHSILGSLRPFLVETNNGVVRAIGTEFDVYRRNDDTQVTLIEGKIEVTSSNAAKMPGAPQPAKRQLVAGQQVRVSRAGISKIEPANLTSTNSWLTGTLEFDNDRLQDVINDLNRYTPTKLVVMDSELADLRISGVFRVGRVESFLDALRSLFHIQAVQAADGTLVLSLAAPKV